MGIVEGGKAQNCLRELPTFRGHFLNPVTGNNEIAVSIIGLPGVMNLAGDLIALFLRLRPFEHRIKIMHQLFRKHVDNFVPCTLPAE
jgi:hypothetical protein